jgi:hypothetical protein
MAILRYLLMLASLAGAGFSINVMATERLNKTDLIAFLLVGPAFVLNFIYLLKHPPQPRPPQPGGQSRIRRLINLWFDAKERELQERGKRPPQSNRGHST